MTGNRSDKPGSVSAAVLTAARMIIYLGLTSPPASSDLPGNRPGKSIAPCLVLLRMGFTYALPVTAEAVVSYTALPPLPAVYTHRGGIFLLHWPWSRLHRTLSGILPCEARTFLTLPENTGKPRSFTTVAATYRNTSHPLFQVPICVFYTLKQLPPTNSRTMEFFGSSSVPTPRK